MTQSTPNDANTSKNTANTTQRTIELWVLGMTSTVKNRDLEGHMRLVSPKVQVYGMPSKPVIDFAEWLARRKVDFKTDDLVSINYEVQRVITSMPRRITFSARENLLDKNGKVIILDKIIILEKEADDCWRVVEETIKAWKVKQFDLN